MITLGVDPALINIGWSLLEYNNATNSYRCLEAGLIKIPQTPTLPTRLLNISQKITQLIVNIQKRYKVSSIGIEETLYNGNAKSSLNLAMARGVIVASLAQAKIPIVEVHPRIIKRFVTGNGNSDKVKVAKYIKLICGSSCPVFKTYDMSDALAIAYTVINSKKIFVTNYYNITNNEGM